MRNSSLGYGQYALVESSSRNVFRANSALKQAWELSQKHTFPEGLSTRDRAVIILKELLHPRTQCYGEAPPNVYAAIIYQSNTDIEIQNALTGLSLNAFATAMKMVATSDLGSHTSTTDCSYVLVSFAVHSNPSPSTNDLFSVFKGNHQALLTGAWIFEGLIHSILCGQSSSINLCGPLLTMKKKESDTAPRFITQQNDDANVTRHLPLCCRSFTIVNLHEVTFAYTLARNIKDQFCVLGIVNNLLFGSFFVELKVDLARAVVWIF
ncbi:uncharacterized protein PHACADRAFT_23812 [Phanerochaete carnosa HHB-10118-sp]|uniref:Uncharacterized protein n=1 Tax=Phanerochaete carnosa (strain HHB-10118-sp) TaxID=650164 RepID=K5XBY9_PHACS|nr:uncharacterized protein PHACADRAFT_23812 [Phanerochaete carnosa HHB-10118-sp]EKM60502.1 hypothetical protein PHACADRAFT_23812 [Phanerochaete carnosa HHB-10118-sp]